MASKTRTFRKVATITTLALAVLWNPLWVYNIAASVVRGVARALLSTGETTINPTKAAIRNVTVDFDELANLVVEFIDGAAPTVQDSFRDFLSLKAAMAHPNLESGLNWLLTSYKFAFPFLVISMIARLTGSRNSAKSLDNDMIGAEQIRPLHVEQKLQLARHSATSSDGPSTPMQTEGEPQFRVLERRHSRFRG